MTAQALGPHSHIHPHILCQLGSLLWSSCLAGTTHITLQPQQPLPFLLLLPDAAVVAAPLSLSPSMTPSAPARPSQWCPLSQHGHAADHELMPGRSHHYLGSACRRHSAVAGQACCPLAPGLPQMQLKRRLMNLTSTAHAAQPAALTAQQLASLTASSQCRRHQAAHRQPWTRHSWTWAGLPDRSTGPGWPQSQLLACQGLLSLWTLHL